eukprot:4275612-Amphidinium_carterae.1
MKGIRQNVPPCECVAWMDHLHLVAISLPQLSDMYQSSRDALHDCALDWKPGSKLLMLLTVSHMLYLHISSSAFLQDLSAYSSKSLLGGFVLVATFGPWCHLVGYSTLLGERFDPRNYADWRHPRHGQFP